MSRRARKDDWGGGGGGGGRTRNFSVIIQGQNLGKTCRTFQTRIRKEANKKPLLTPTFAEI
jgi:hypothetical protein